MSRFLTFVVILVSILAIFPIYTRFKVSAAPVPPGVYLGGLELSSLKETDEIRRHLEQIYTEPIVVYYADERLVLRPDDIGFHVDVDQMVAEASSYLEGPAFLDIALRQALGVDQQRRDIPIRYMLDADRLRSWLEAVAAEHDQEPQAPRVFAPETRWSDGLAAVEGMPLGYVGAMNRDWTWVEGEPGYTLNPESSVAEVIRALTALDQDRVADLVLDITPSPMPAMADLERALDSYFSDFPGFAAVYVHDLSHRDEANVDADVSFSGMSTLKIGIVTAIMAQLDGIEAGDTTSSQVGQWIDFALGESNNFAANLLLQFLGDGTTAAGTRRFTEFMRELGFINTYMQSGYDVETQLAQIPTPGNQRDDWNTNPDTNLQSTPAEMGRMLTAVYDCTLGKGLLIETFGDRITPRECDSILFYMGHDQFQEMVWSGLPRLNENWIVHKHGFAFESHSDVALIWGPTGPYVLSIFLYRRGWMDWQTSNEAMKDASRITWNFFEFQREHGGPAPDPAPDLRPPSGYIPINEYIPSN